ncbi:hypothetical protein [Paenibacillus sp. GbtcB18]|uniref:hypothetical protein n=1 Tax=Paenibacillus sp. GbtcB18 TaxID=2824763 RepID=UPI001C3048E3|nr:hypothetical protein [Paenibacillus sp. GbtcB18]
MNDITSKQLSNPYSTGGGGIHFENRVQASFVVLMLTGGFAPCLPTWPINEIKFQGKYDGFDVDDLILFAKQLNGDKQAKLLGQIKHSVKVIKGNSIFGEVIKAAWNDFTNEKLFIEGLDAIALITGPLSAKDTIHVRALLEQAKEARDTDDFFKRINLAKFTSNEQREKLDVFRTHLKAANHSKELTDEQLWRFLKSFNLLIYDLDIKGVTLSLLHTLIGQYSQDRVKDLWALILESISWKSASAGLINLESIDEDIRLAFQKPIINMIPEDFEKTTLQVVEQQFDIRAHASVFVLANFLGSWNEQFEGDRELISNFVGEDYFVWISELRKTIHYPSCPISLKDGVWRVNNRDEFWEELAPYIHDDVLDKFQHCAEVILTERDPKFELLAEERFAASLHGKNMKYSQTLRKGIAESLALLGSRSDNFTSCSFQYSERIVVTIVNKVFANADWVLWASLNSLLPYIAEAAPETFLKKIEGTLTKPKCPFDELFIQERSGLTGENYLTGLLWALETLAWEERFLVNTTVILGELAERDPGGNSANRPSRSLVTIFLPWFPQTVASIVKRKVAIETLTNEYPEVGWGLILNLLPNRQQTSSGSRIPKWRKLPLEWNRKVSQDEYWDQVSNYADLAVQIVKHDFNKLTELVTFLDHLPQKSNEELLEYLSSELIINMPEDERVYLWTNLYKLILKHKKFSEAKWALNSVMINKIEEVTKALAPKDPINLNRPLFGNRESDLYEEFGNIQGQWQQLNERRKVAIEQIYNYGGTNAVFRFVDEVESPRSVGNSLGSSSIINMDSDILPKFLDLNDNKYSQFTFAFILGRYNSQGWKWVDQIKMFGWTKAQMTKFFSSLPFSEETWERVDQQLGDLKADYWSIVIVNPYQVNSEAGLKDAIDQLLEYGRPVAAIKCLNKMLHDSQHLDSARTIRALLAIDSSNEQYFNEALEIVELIKSLQENPDTFKDDLFQIEWMYLTILNESYAASPKLLEQKLACDPDFFCQVIRLVYRSSRDSMDTETTESQKVLAENAFQLLSTWRNPPGLRLDGRLSGEDFRKWLLEIKSICKETGHLEVALQHVGKVLVYCPADSSGLWIDKNAAKALNARDAEEMRVGFRIELFNSRGVHWVDHTGSEERELAEKYRKQAEAIENAGYHRFAATIRELSGSYEREAKQVLVERRDM